jgi:hypothetical protein
VQIKEMLSAKGDVSFKVSRILLFYHENGYRLNAAYLLKIIDLNLRYQKK